MRDDYWAWNSAIEAVVFPVTDDPQPAYLSLDDEQRAELADALGIEAVEIDSRLSGAVRPALAPPNERTGLFEGVNGKLALWRRRRRDERGAPPVLPLLALLSVAGEHMAHGGGMAEHNFYGRVMELLERPDWNARFQNGYRRYGEGYWAALERWLEDNDGLRGLPTAVAIGHRHIGLPISQALMRAGDRTKLPAFFSQWGFPPGSSVPPSELEGALDRWIQTDPCPVSGALEHQWQSSALRSRILEIASTALAAWDGRVSERASTSGTQTARLALQVGTFPRARVEFSPVAYLPDADTARLGEIKTSDGWSQVELTPFGPGIMRLGQGQAFDNRSLLEGVLEVIDSAGESRIVRNPRRVMVFRRVELAGAFIEAEQVMLGEDVYVVARDEPHVRRAIEKVLEACARPGWDWADPGFGGLPEGWLLYRGVQMFADPGGLIPPQALDLRALVPLTKSQLLVTGGLALPGSVRGKWHVKALPEVRAVSDAPGGFALKLIDYGYSETEGDVHTLLQTWEVHEPGAVVADLSELELEPGTYKVELHPSGAQSAASTVTLRLRSGDEIDQKQRDVVTAADQFLDDPLSVLSASEVTGDRAIAGAVVQGCDSDGTRKTADVPTTAHWTTTRSHRTKSILRIETVPSTSCLYTGAHRTTVETPQVDGSGRPLVKFVTGTCSVCGLSRQFPTTAYRARKKHHKARALHATAPPSTPPLAPVTDRAEIPRWDVVLDATRHCGGGTPKTFDRLALFAEPSALMADHLLRTFHSLAHIDLLRDPETLELQSWDIAPAALVPTPSGLYLAGTWPDALVRHHVRQNPGLRLLRAENPEGPASYFFNRLPTDLVEGVHVTGPALDLAVQLPPISSVIDRLPRVEATPRVAGLTFFDVTTAKWVDATSMSAVGGYRIRGFTTDDVLRTEEDLRDGSMAISTVHLSKHASAYLWGRQPLVAYEQRTGVLTVPLGANLPGLYERALVLASGFPPRPSKGSLQYFQVPQELAEHLTHLLTH